MKAKLFNVKYEDSNFSKPYIRGGVVTADPSVRCVVIDLSATISCMEVAA